MSADTLSLRALNRATLARQLLLGRSALTPAQAITHLAGLQAQAPLAPYVGLWTRLAAFRPQQLENLMNERGVLRAHLMRHTIHLVDARDFLRFRPLFQPLLSQGLRGNLARRLAGVDLEELRAVAADLLAQTPLTRLALARALAPRWPDHDPGLLANAAAQLLVLVQIPPRGRWGQSGPATWALADTWLDDHAPTAPPTSSVAPTSPISPTSLASPTSQFLPATRVSLVTMTSSTPADLAAAAAELILRYLAAYGPATVADIQAWSGLTRLREVTERLGERLRPLAGPDGAPLLDLADAPADPGPDTPAPPRFLPEYDNLLLSYAERSRVIPHRRPVPLPPGNGASAGTLLVDGCWQADWRIRKDPGVLEIRPFVPLSAADRDAVAAEGQRLLGFVRPADAARDVRFVRDGE
ncbi:MAG TPA: winged helix DNA-binding domain-containing protein [Streptosporangiaceae bacterium]|nr:winged helix DNA-binding domain-containing protein [Streptosporangiaceae bacterium]